MGRPPKPGQVRMVIRIPEEFADQLREESRRRSMTIGDLVMEAFASRVISTVQITRIQKVKL